MKSDEAGNKIEFLGSGDVTGIGTLQTGDTIKIYNSDNCLIATYKIVVDGSK